MTSNFALRCRQLSPLFPLVRSYSSCSNVDKCLQELSAMSVVPDTPQYKVRTKIYNPAFAREHPAFVALPESIEDCQKCLSVATYYKVPVAVRSGGHCFGGYSTIDACGFVISLIKMKEIEWSDSTVKVQAGSSWGNVYDQMDDSKYLVVGGCCPSVGIGGYVLGGGYGLLSRRFGLASDNTLNMTMVSADGERVVSANQDENSDLFWSLCGGGGGNFGILIDATFKLHPAPPSFTWSSFNYHSTGDSEKALKLIAQNIDKMPDGLNVDMLIHKLSGYKQLVVDAVYSDSEIEKSSVIQGLKEIVDSHSEVYTHYKKLSKDYAERHGYVHFEGEPVYMKGSFLNDIPPQLVDELIQLELPDDPLGIIEFVHVGGKIMNKSPSFSAYPHRYAQYNCYTYGQFHKSESEWDIVYGFASQVHNLLTTGGYAKGSYVNYMDPLLYKWQEEYYGTNYAKLCELKKIWNAVDNGGPMHFLQEIGSSYEP